MLKKEIKTGNVYTAKVSNIICNVRVDQIDLSKNGTRYHVTNLRTGRKTVFSSAAKFRSEVKARGTKEYAALPFSKKTEGEKSPPFTSSSERQEEVLSPEPLNSSPPFNEAKQNSNEFTKPISPEAKVERSTVEESASANSAKPGDSSEIDLEAPLCPVENSLPVPVSDFKPTDEQEAILAISKQLEGAKALINEIGQRVLVICAGAGAGKTSTLRLLEKVLKGQGQYTAFNASLCNESKSKFLKCAVNTTHSLAFREVGKRYAHRLKGARVKSYQVARMLGIEDFYVTVEDASGSSQSKRLLGAWLASKMMKAIAKFCQSADPVLTLKHFSYIDGIDSTREGKRSYENNDQVKKYLLPFAERAWADMENVNGTMPFTHDAYVKIWSMGEGPNRPVIAADYILLDEHQDTAPVFVNVLKQQEHALLILVGDDNQRIYEWRGAINAGEEFPKASRKLLSQSFRFGQAVADVANSVLAELEERTDLVMKGLTSIPSRICEVTQPRCYLYRTNAGAVGRLMAAMKEGKRGHLIGGSKEVIDFCKAAMDLQGGKGTSHPELGSFSKWGEVVAYSLEDEGEDLRLMVKLITEFGADKIHAALENMPSEQDADLVLSTAHRSKGREWKSVKLGPDFPTANKLSDADRRLVYVACTRAQEELDLTACPTFCGGYDRKFGGGEAKWIPGIKVKYTSAMPTVEELAAYRGSRPEEVKPVRQAVSSSPQETAPRVTR